MLEAAIVLISFYSLTWIIQQSSLLSIPRNWLMRSHMFFSELLSCSFCTGFYSGWLIYLIYHYPNVSDYSYSKGFLWSLAGAGVSYILNLVVEKLSINKLI